MALYCGNKDNFYKWIKLLKQGGREFKTIEHGNVAKIFLNNGSQWLFIDKEDNPNKNIPVLCRMVAKNVKNYLSKKEISIIKKCTPIFEVNFKVLKKAKPNDLFYAVDLVACYWDIAFKKGFITKNTYQKGLLLKEERNIALGSLNKTIKEVTYKDGKSYLVYSKSETSIFWNEILHEVERIYYDLTKLVGLENYIAWETDCLYTNIPSIMPIKKYMDDNNIRFNFYSCYFTEITDSEAHFIIVNSTYGQDKTFHIYNPKILETND